MIISLDTLPGFEQWRVNARAALVNRIPPETLVWQCNNPLPHGTAQQLSLLKTEPTDNLNRLSATIKLDDNKSGQTVFIPKSFMALAELACCHHDPARFSLLYRMAWRLVTENRQLLNLLTDDDVLTLTRLVKAVRRDAYKIKAFLRFRETKDNDHNPLFVSWYQPEHYTLELALPFFQTRFHNMRWVILTPYRAAFWDGNQLTLADNPNPSLYPTEDAVEHYWLTYYASTFNPARTSKSAMLTQMPKKYWHNMPETVLIEDLLANAHKRVGQMIDPTVD